MELDEMKMLWGEMSAEIEKQKKLTGSLIIKMTAQDYRNKINKIFYPEAISSVVALAEIVYILINIQKLNNWYLLSCGIITVLALITLPLLSFKTIHRMKSVNILDKNLKQSLLDYSKAKLQFVFVQKLNFYLGSVLMLAILPVMGMIMAGKDFFKETNMWLWLCVGFPFYYLFANWVFKSYKRMADAAGNILKEVEE